MYTHHSGLITRAIYNAEYTHTHECNMHADRPDWTTTNRPEQDGFMQQEGKDARVRLIYSISSDRADLQCRHAPSHHRTRLAGVRGKCVAFSLL